MSYNRADVQPQLTAGSKVLFAKVLDNENEAAAGSPSAHHPNHQTRAPSPRGG